MKRTNLVATTALAVACAMSAGATQAASILTTTFDLTGVAVDLGFGDNFLVTTEVFDFGVPGTVIGVDFEVAGESFDWTSEVAFGIDTDLDTTFDADIVLGDFGAPDAAEASFFYSGSVAASSPSDGLVLFTPFDLVEFVAGPEAVISSGFITVTYEAVPEPSAGLLLLLGSVGGWFYRRR